MLENNKFKSAKGVITILVALMLTGILSLGTLVLELGRFQAAKTQLSEANISAGTSMLANYDTTLYDRYGLLAIDERSATRGRYQHYLEFNSDLSAGYKGNNISTLYNINSSEMDTLYSLASPAVLKRQILSRAKYKIVHNDYVLNYYNIDYFFEDLQAKADYVKSVLVGVRSASRTGNLSDIPGNMSGAIQVLYETFTPMKRYDEEYKVTLNEDDINLLPSVTGTSSETVYSEDIDAINAATSDAYSVLGSYGSMLASGGASTYSEVDVSVSINPMLNTMSIISTPKAIYDNSLSIVSNVYTTVNGINAAINTLKSDKDGNLLLNSYIAGFLSNKNMVVETYNGPAKNTATVSGNSTFTAACTEYVFGGNKSETANQQAAYEYILATRMVTNLYSAFKNSSQLKTNSRANVAAHVVWAYYESLVDAELLLKYNATVPFAKYNMILSINNPDSVKAAFVSKKFANAMTALDIIKPDGKIVVQGADKTNYRDALALALWIVPNSKKLVRVADVVQLEMRYTQQYVEKENVDFLMKEKNTFCRVKCTAKTNSVLPVIAPSSSNGINGTAIQSIKYVGY